MAGRNRAATMAATLFAIAVLAIGGASVVVVGQNGHGDQGNQDQQGNDDDQGNGSKTKDKVLYVWAQDEDHVSPDFLAVIDFDQDSSRYGSVIKTVPIPPPGNFGNEPHHCHLNSTKQILGCGGLLSLLKDQNGIFFFDVSDAKNPRFLLSTRAVDSSITDDFLPLDNGGFLISQMGAADGTSPGRVAEYDGQMHFVGNHFGTTSSSMFKEWPSKPPLDGFNPHGISSRPDLNLMMTSDFIEPASTLVGSPGPVLRNTVRVWDFRARKITKTVPLLTPDGSPALGVMDVKMVPQDRRGVGYAAGMFDGFIYLIDPISGTAVPAFDCTTVLPHVDTEVRGGMGQIMALPQSGDRLIFALFQAGQVGMLDTTDRANLQQLSVVNFGKDAGPHNLMLSSDDRRLVVSDYFLNEDEAGLIHFEGDHKVHVINVGRNTLTEDPRFNLDFNSAFPTGPARPHGIAMK